VRTCTEVDTTGSTVLYETRFTSKWEGSRREKYQNETQECNVGEVDSTGSGSFMEQSFGLNDVPPFIQIHTKSERLLSQNVEVSREEITM
jgi:hypothetical protein